MKKILSLVLCIIITTCILHAREPYGDYICRYIVTGNPTTYHKIYNPLKITHQGIQVKNTNSGTKIWLAKYQGPVRLSNSGGSERFHNFYLTKQHVEFSISDRKFVTYQGKQYYVIILDDQIQLAEALY